MTIVNTLKKLGVAVSLFALSQGPAHAIITTYTDLTLWESAVASYTTEDFNNPALQNLPVNAIPAGSYVGPLTSITSFGSPAVISGGQMLDTLDVQGGVDTRFDFNPSVFAVSADWNLAIGGLGSQIRVNTAAGSEVLSLAPNPLIGFWGFTTDSAILSVELVEANPLMGIETYLLDNLRMATALAAVPEPAILALMGLGLIGIGFSRRKRKA